MKHWKISEHEETSDVSNLLMLAVERRVCSQNISVSFGDKTPNTQTHLPKSFLPSRKHCVCGCQCIWQTLLSYCCRRYNFTVFTIQSNELQVDLPSERKSQMCQFFLSPIENPFHNKTLEEEADTQWLSSNFCKPKAQIHTQRACSRAVCWAPWGCFSLENPPQEACTGAERWRCTFCHSSSGCCQRGSALLKAPLGSAQLLSHCTWCRNSGKT